MLCENVSTGVSMWVWRHVCIACVCAHVCISVWTFGCGRKLLSMWEPCSLTSSGLSHMVVCRWQQQSPRGHRPQQRLSVHIWHLVRASSRPPWPVGGCYFPPTILQRKKFRAQRGRITLLMSHSSRWQVGQEPKDLGCLGSPPPSHSHRCGNFPLAPALLTTGGQSSSGRRGIFPPHPPPCPQHSWAAVHQALQFL